MVGIVFRDTLGHNLDAPDFDDMIRTIVARIVALETALPGLQGVGMGTFSVVGNVLTITMTDATTRTVLLPTATWSDGGEWAPATVYTAGKILTVAGAVILVTFNHLSAATFDINANDGAGHNYYKQIYSAPSQPNDLHVFVGGGMNPSQLILRYIATRRWQLPASLTGSLFLSGVAADDDTIITLKKNGASIGTITWDAGDTVPTVVFAIARTFEITDIFTMEGPAIADLTLADISFDLLGNRI